ncbi:YetF domain-containing protein [Paenibacillus sp. FSL R7-0345]|uniref:YetF domain-containing protein n=1 Tax=Paenibacillus sp. FSL R7-0345 TaxID=2954535 RepID=UPI00315B3E7B
MIIPSEASTGQQCRTATVVIENGKIMEDNFAHNRLTVQWLEQVLQQRSKSVSDVFYAVRGTQNQLYFDS